MSKLNYGSAKMLRLVVLPNAFNAIFNNNFEADEKSAYCFLKSLFVAVIELSC